MNNRFPPKLIITAIAILSVLYFSGLAFAKEIKASVPAEDISGLKQEQAIKYREQGAEYQRMGNLAQALSFYQKAVAMYPNFAVAYNDIGVIYEAQGSVDRAEENYLKSIKIDPAYASAYTNLALLYENQRNLDKAAFYWEKRAGLGSPDDLWTQRAASRLRDIRMSLSGKPFADEREEEVLSLMRDIVANKTKFNKEDLSLAQEYFKKAKLSFNRGDMALATKEALDAQYLDQNNPEIEAFIEKAELRGLTR